MYVISIPCICGMYGEPLEPEIQYATINNVHHYPEFGGFWRAKIFDSEEEARDWFEKNQEYLPNIINPKHYDWKNIKIERIDMIPVSALEVDFL